MANSIGVCQKQFKGHLWYVSDVKYLHSLADLSIPLKHLWCNSECRAWIWLHYIAAEAITMPGTWLMHWYIMPRFPKHMFEGGFLNYPQANTQPDFPKCHTPSSQGGQKGLQSAQHRVNNMRISWWKSAPASARWFDTWKHHTPHSNQPVHSALKHQQGLNFLCLPPWFQAAAQLHPRCTKFP